MAEIFNFMLDFIRIDLLIGFGWYSVFFFLIKLFLYKKEFFAELDKTACKTAVFLGVLYGLIWFFASVITYLCLLDSQGKTDYVQRLCGPYSFGIWLQPLFWVTLTQLLRLNSFRKFLLLRLMISIFFILSFENIVIMYTSFHRDYLPSSWTMYTSEFGISWYDFLLSIVIKTMEFVIITLIFQCIIKFLSQSKKVNFN